MFSKLAPIASRQGKNVLKRGVQRYVSISLNKNFKLNLNNSSNYARCFSTEKIHDAEVAEKVADAEVVEDKNLDDKPADAIPQSDAEDNKMELDDLDDNEKAPDADDFVDAASEAPKGEAEKFGFQAETRRILDIVANSLYTDTEVFVRELISNASDALEKARYLQQTSGLIESSKDLEIRMYVNEKENTLVIQDFGVGMTKAEMIENLGTIAKSGSKEFVQRAAEAKDGQAVDASNIIGQFGVGFYSLFMVSDDVRVFSKSASPDAEDVAHMWRSDGSGEYEINEAEGVQRGTKIVIKLKERAKQFAVKHVIEGIIKKYSNFVGFPISLNEKKINTVGALWSQDKNSISEEQHLEFYRYIANAYDSPYFHLQFQTDAPIDIRCLLYFPEKHLERFGMGRMEPGVSLYSRKVLIQAKCKQILPEWLRFIKGVVDSEDIPLNISRENMQDSALITRMSSVLTKKVIKYLVEQSKKDNEKYMKFYNEFNSFLKEGVCSDFMHKADIAQLLRYDTSLGEKQLQSLDEYIGRMPPDQTEIYYLNAPSREFALSSPYYETFDAAGTEVLFLYTHIDDFVFKHLEKYAKRPLVSIEKANVAKKKEEPVEDSAEKAKKEKNEKTLVAFFSEVLKDKVSSVKATDRLLNSPAIVVDHESAAVRSMMKFTENENKANAKQKLEVNPSHKTMKKLITLQSSNKKLATLLAEQIFDNALIAADIMENPRVMLNRLNEILDVAANESASKATDTPASKATDKATEASA